jgi:hypothetical protein
MRINYSLLDYNAHIGEKSELISPMEWINISTDAAVYTVIMHPKVKLNILMLFNICLNIIL